MRAAAFDKGAHLGCFVRVGDALEMRTSTSAALAGSDKAWVSGAVVDEGGGAVQRFIVDPTEAFRRKKQRTERWSICLGVNADLADTLPTALRASRRPHFPFEALKRTPHGDHQPVPDQHLA